MTKLINIAANDWVVVGGAPLATPLHIESPRSLRWAILSEDPTDDSPGHSLPPGQSIKFDSLPDGQKLWLKSSEDSNFIITGAGGGVLGVSILDGGTPIGPLYNGPIGDVQESTTGLGVGYAATAVLTNGVLTDLVLPVQPGICYSPGDEIELRMLAFQNYSSLPRIGVINVS